MYFSFIVNLSVVTRPIKVGLFMFALNANAKSTLAMFVLRSSDACVAVPTGMPVVVPVGVVFPVTVKLPPTVKLPLTVTAGAS